MIILGGDTKMKEKKCIWQYNVHYEIYDTDCEEIFPIVESDIEEEFKYCPFCGKKIEITKST